MASSARAKAELEQVRLDIGANAHGLRRKSGVTQAKLAERLGVTVEHLRGIEAGKRSASLALLSRLAVEFGVPTRDLLKRTAAAAARNPGRPRRVEP